MGPLKRLAASIAQKAAAYAGISFSIGDPQLNQKLSDAGWYWGSSSATGKAINDSTSMNVTAFFAGVRLLSETMGGLPKGVFLRQGENALPAPDHRLHEVLVHQPNEYMDGLQYEEASTANLAARGNAYSLIARGGDGNVSALWPLEACRMKVKMDQSTNYQLVYSYNDRGKWTDYPPDQIWHRRLFSFGGLVGLSPIECAREALGLALAGEEFNARLFAQGLMPSARVSIPEWLDKAQRKLANERLAEMHSGLANMGKPMLLEGGMKVESGLITPEDAQFLALRQLTVVEICRILGIKPHMVAALERATDNNIERLSLEFVTYTMLPYIRRSEMAARKLFKPADRDKFFLRYNFEGLLRADSAARAQLYSILLQNGVFNRNEVRALENRNKSDDPEMDKFTVQSNMTPIDLLAALISARDINKQPAQPAADPSKDLSKAFEAAIAAVSASMQPPALHIHEGAVKVDARAPTTVNFERDALHVEPTHLHMPSAEQQAAQLRELHGVAMETVQDSAEHARRLREELFKEAADRAAPGRVMRRVMKHVLERDAEGRIVKVQETEIAV